MKKILITIAGILLLNSCANIVPPTGGERDLIPPIVDNTKSIPNKTNNINYKENFVELSFNEKVGVKNEQVEITTTPLLDSKKFKVNASKNKVRLDFNQPLDSNTTYIVNFGKSIIDLTESNVAENIQLAFSTGSFIDSLELSGKVVDHLTNQPIANSYVYLYDVADTIKPLEGKPKYYTKTNALGSYNFNHLKEGSYEVIALVEKFQNYTYERNKEQIGFLNTPLLLDTIVNNTTLYCIKEADTVFKINSISPRENYLQIKLNKGFEKDLSKYPSEIKRIYNEEMNTIQLFGSAIDSSIINLSLIDSSGIKLDSIFKVKIEKKQSSQTLVKSIKNNFATDSSFIVLNSLEPLKTIRLDSIIIKRLSDSTIVSKEQLKLKKEANDTRLRFYHPKFKSDTLIVEFRDSCFESVTGTFSKMVQHISKPVLAEDFGIIKGSISTSYKKYLIQLIDNKGVIVKETNSKLEYTFNLVEPGNYTIRVLIDENNDNTFGKGDFNNRITPELIYFYEKPLTIKANWEFFDTNLSF